MDFSALIGLASSGAGFLFGRFRKGGARNAWQTAAETYGLLHKPSGFWSGPKLSGSLSGNELTVDIKDRNTASAATRFRLDMPSLNLGLKLRKRKFWNSLGSRVVTGDRDFDSQVVVTARNEQAVREFLTPERRVATQSFVSAFKGAVVTDDRISLTTRGQVSKPDDMLGAIDSMLQVANVLSAVSDPTSAGGDDSVPAAAMAAMAATAAATSMIPVTLELEDAGIAGTRDSADAAADAPDDPFEPEPEPMPELETEAEAEVKAEVEAEGEPDAATPADSLTPQEPSPAVEEFCAAVFAPGALSFTANQKFKSTYEGAHVAWAGTLESTTPFTFDFDFGSARGVKAVLTILEGGGARSRDVQAVIGLPPGAEGLVERIGQRVSFTGRLLKVDGLAKRVVIADAELRA